jgi:DNA polymerase III epsilon subunit family exonuclease
MGTKDTATRRVSPLQRVDAAVWSESPPTMPFAVVDVETTGLNPSVDRVIEVAVIRCAPDGTVNDEWSTLVDPGRDPGATHIHGITADDLLDAPTFASIAPELLARLDGHMVCAHNLSFDEAFLSAELAAAGLELPETSSLCTLELARAVLSEQRRHTLAACAAALGIDHDSAHRALADTRVTVAVLTAMIDLRHPAQGSLFD